MSNIVQELRTSKRHLTETFDVDRRRGSTNVVVTADDNNNDSYYNALSSSQMETGGGTWSHWRPALTPTSSAARRRTGQSRSKRRRGRAELCYDQYGALDLTSAKNAVRTSNTGGGVQPSTLSSASSAAMNLVIDDSVPLDLTVHGRAPYVQYHVSSDEGHFPRTCPLAAST